MKSIAIALSLLLVTAAAGNAQVFTLDGVGNCPDQNNGVTFNLSAGTVNIEWVSGAYSLWSNNGENNGFTWVAVVRAYVHATGDVISFGDPSSTFYLSHLFAETVGQGTYALTIPATGPVTFYLSDGGGCGDNRGIITLELLSTVPTLEKTWGAIKALYQQR